VETSSEESISLQEPKEDVDVDSVTAIEDFESAGAKEIEFMERIEPVVLKWNRSLRSKDISCPLLKEVNADHATERCGLYARDPKQIDSPRAVGF
jgi:hypothetical protein